MKGSGSLVTICLLVLITGFHQIQAETCPTYVACQRFCATAKCEYFPRARCVEATCGCGINFFEGDIRVTAYCSIPIFRYYGYNK
ncbi:Hypothetical predicted protein [Octopus vulgaris]|uniref:TIL domain-containing protein n=1 Tax=Octopus vulgaris TaxID=6645 RepID=A0AA36BQV4_OCTVU|nr:Hypothetical predicted protein [Octopus vulgaris]